MHFARLNRFVLSGFLIAWTTASVEGVPITKELDFDKYGHVRNANCGQVPRAEHGVCAAAAVINSLAFLRNNYPERYAGTQIVRDANRDGKMDVADLRILRDELSVRGWDADGQGPKPGRGGMYTRGSAEFFQDIWEAKVEWVEDWAPGTTIFRGEVKTDQKNIRREWAAGSGLRNTFPTWDFLFNQIDRGEDVELAFFPVGEMLGHAVTLTGVSFDDRNGNGTFDPGEPRGLILLDPNAPMDKRTVEGVVEAPDKSLRFRYLGKERILLAAYSESPRRRVPEPSTWIILGAGFAVGGWIAARKTPGVSSKSSNRADTSTESR